MPTTPVPASARRTLLPALAAAAVAAVLALAARGMAGDEETGHYLASRYALADPRLFLGTAARPLVTLGFCLPAQLGLIPARLLAALLTGLTALAVARVVDRGRWLHPTWGIVFLLIQPFYLAHAGTTMTEPWAAALLAWGLWATVERRPAILAGVAALLPLARMETLVFWPFVIAVLARDRGLRHLWMLPLPIVAWNGGGALAYGDPLWLWHQSSWQAYFQREPLHYVRGWVWITGLGLFVPVLGGLVEGAVLLAAPHRAPDGPSSGIARARRRALAASATVVAVFLTVYTVLAVWQPVTLGNLRYFAYAAPALAVLAAAGTRLLIDRPPVRAGVAIGMGTVGALVLWNHPLLHSFGIMVRPDRLPAAVAGGWIAFALLSPRLRRFAPAAILIVGGADLAARHREDLHLVPTPEQAAVAGAARMAERGLAPGVRLYAAHPLLAYELGRNPYDPAAWPPFTDRLIAAAPRGAVLFWDSHYVPVRGSDLDLATLHADSTWTYAAGTVASDSSWTGAFFVRTGRRDSTNLPPATAGLAGLGMPARDWWGVAPLVLGGIPTGRADLRADPDNAGYWLILAQRLAGLGLDRQAGAALDRAERLAPRNPFNAAFRAELLRIQGDEEGARLAARRALELRPGEPVFRYLLGRILLEAGHPDQAAPELAAAAARLPKRADVQSAAGDAYYGLKRYADAEPFLLRALALSPRDVDVAIKTAEIAWRLGNRDESLRRLRAFIRRRPEATTPYLVLGDLLTILGRDAEAREVWEEGLEKTGGDPAIASRLHPPSTSGHRE